MELYPVTGREMALAIIPKITGGLSMLGSCFLSYRVFRDPHKRNRTYHRLLLTMSLCDFITSLGYFASTWPIPPGENQAWQEPYSYGAVGNTPLCVAQGFAIQWGLATAFLNTALAGHYLLVIRFNYREGHLKKLEPYCLGAALTAGLGLTLPGIFLKIYQPGHLWCWISPNLTLCEEMGIADDAECVHMAYHKRWVFYFIPVWICISIITVLQLMLFASVRRLERRSSRWRSTDSLARQYRQSRQVAKQATCYVSVFYVTWLPYTGLVATGRLFKPYYDLDFAVLLLVVIFSPLQGFLNFLAYRHEYNVPSISKSMVAVSTVVSQAVGRRITPIIYEESKSIYKHSGEAGSISAIPVLDTSASRDEPIASNIDTPSHPELQDSKDTKEQQETTAKAPSVAWGVDVGTDDSSLEYRDEISEIYGL